MTNNEFSRHNIVRKSLSIRHIPLNDGLTDVVIWHNNDKNGKIVQSVVSHQIVQLCNGFNMEKDRSLSDYENEIRIAYDQIYKLEEYIMIFGNKENAILGMNDTKTIRYNLQDAIKEFEPSHMITSNKEAGALGLIGIEVIQSTMVPENTYFLYRQDPMDLEFVISEDITIDNKSPPYSAELMRKYGTTRTDEEINELEGKIPVYVYEWVAFELHDVDKIVKVVDDQKS